MLGDSRSGTAGNASFFCSATGSGITGAGITGSCIFRSSGIKGAGIISDCESVKGTIRIKDKKKIVIFRLLGVMIK